MHGSWPAWSRMAWQPSCGYIHYPKRILRSSIRLPLSLLCSCTCSAPSFWMSRSRPKQCSASPLFWAAYSSFRAHERAINPRLSDEDLAVDDAANVNTPLVDQVAAQLDHDPGLRQAPLHPAQQPGEVGADRG